MVFLFIMLMALLWYVHLRVQSVGVCTGFDVYRLLVTNSLCTGAECCQGLTTSLFLGAEGP